MPKSDYVKKPAVEFSAQLITFKTLIGGYATQLGVTPAQVTAQAADADYFAYLVAGQQVSQNTAQQWTEWRDSIRTGGAAGSPPSTTPGFPASVPAVAPGIEARFRALVNQIKAHANYHPSIGEALGIEGAEQTSPDLETIQPEITLKIVGDEVRVGWGWQGNSAFLDLIELQVDRGQGWQTLAMDTTPNYNDSTPFPATPTRWKYRAIYRVGDARVGQWSTEVSITVGG